MKTVRGGWMPALLGAAALAMSLATPAAAAVTLTEGTFASATFSFTPTYAQNGATILAGQCLACGQPDSALRFRVDYDGPGAASLGVVLNNLSYDPGAQGNLASIDFSAIKNIRTTSTGNSTSTLRPLIAQGGSFYLAAIPLPDFTGPATTGYVGGSANLTAADFLLYDFASGTFGTANPNFAGGVLRFGIGQISSTPFDGENSSRIDYDNLSFTLNQAALPEPATWALMIGGAGLTGGTLRRRRTLALRTA